MPRFTRETKQYFEGLEKRFREIDQMKKREALSTEKPDEAIEIEKEEIGALPVRPKKKKETGPST